MFSLESLVYCVVYLIVAGLVWWLLWWALHELKPREPFYTVARVILTIGAVLVTIAILLNLIGRPLVRAAALQNQGPWM